jgi:hypothetical protein
VSAGASRQRLAQAQRIAALKVRRQERERIAAVRAQHEAEARAHAAAARSAAADQAHGEARSLFFAAPQLAAAEVWLVATDTRAGQARSERAIAEDSSANAASAAAAARREHERMIQRADYLDDRAVSLARVTARRTQERADEDIGERRA